MTYLRDDSGRLRASLRALVPAVVTLLAFVVGLATLGAAVGTVETISPGVAVVAFLAQLVLYGALAAAAAWMAARFERRSLAAVWPSVDAAWLRQFAAGATASVVGVAVSLGWGAVRGLRAVDLGNFGVAGTADPLAVAALLGVFACYFLAGNVYEEVVYRRVVLQNFADGLAARGLSTRTAVAVATAASLLLFGLYHVPLRGTLVVAADAALTGTTFAFAYLLSGDLGLAVGVHFGRLPTVFATGRTLAGIEVTPVVELTSTTVAANLEVRLVQVALVCLLVAAYHVASGGDLALADSVRQRGDARTERV